MSGAAKHVCIHDRPSSVKQLRWMGPNGKSRGSIGGPICARALVLKIPGPCRGRRDVSGASNLLMSPSGFPGHTCVVRILFAEDDDTLREYVSRGLREAGYAVDPFASGDEGLLAATTVDYDVAILDINLPGMSGFEVCRRIRQEVSPGPAILFLTARDTVDDRVHGLDLGAEDYLVKPFAFAELLARVRALLRRGPGAAAVLRVADLELDPGSHTVARAGADIRLTAKEFGVLEYLMRNAGRVVSKTMIAEHVWDFDLEAETNFIEVFIYTLRKKVDAPFDCSLIHTVRGLGYRIDAIELPS